MFSAELGVGPWTRFPQVLPALRLGRGWFQGCGTFGGENVRSGCAPPAGPQRGLHPGTAIEAAPPAPGASRGAFERRVSGQEVWWWSLVPLDQGSLREDRVRQQSIVNNVGSAVRLGFQALPWTRCSASIGLSFLICKRGIIAARLCVAQDKSWVHVRCDYFYYGHSPRCSLYSIIMVTFYNMSHPPKC